MSHNLQKIIKYVIVFVLIFTSYTLLINFCNVNCPRDFVESSEEVVRIKSPDQVVEAVLMKFSGTAATDACIYQVYLVRSGQQPEGRTQRFEAIKIDGLIIDWLNSSHLQISYRHADIYFFRNKSYLFKEDKIEKEIVITLNQKRIKHFVILHWSVRIILNSATGEVVKLIDYDEFGTTISSFGEYINPFGYAGGLTNQHTGFIRFGARDCDPKTGRWTHLRPTESDFGGQAAKDLGAK